MGDPPEICGGEEERRGLREAQMLGGLMPMLGGLMPVGGEELVLEADWLVAALSGPARPPDAMPNPPPRVGKLASDGKCPFILVISANDPPPFLRTHMAAQGEA
jgi:hypothetical protein